MHPQLDLIQLADSDGTSNEVSYDFYDQHEHAFVHELQAFANRLGPASAVDDLAFGALLETNYVNGDVCRGASAA